MIEAATNPVVIIGSEGGFRVVDNGEGANEPPDQAKGQAKTRPQTETPEPRENKTTAQGNGHANRHSNGHGNGENGSNGNGRRHEPRRLQIVFRPSGDLEREKDLSAFVEAADAVVFAAGAGPGSGAGRKETMDYGGAIRLIEAARKAGAGFGRTP